MTYVRAQKSQIDAWGALGNPGWSWDCLFPYYLKSEGFEIPTPAQVAAGGTYIASYHNTTGPLKTGYAYELLNGTFHSTVQDSWKAIGIRHNEDMNGGDVHGFKVWQSTVDRNADVREDAASAYYYPVEGRANLHVFVDTIANKILWADGSGDAVASGVEVTFSNGTVGTFGVVNEVIVSAGSLRSPAILELSGVGNPRYGQSNQMFQPPLDPLC
jgi:choline dehydrogenase-like flavoprotein